MALVHIALQEGFSADTVVVKVNDNEVFRDVNVKTRYQIGLAASFEANAEGDPAKVEVLLPLKNLRETINLQGSTPIYLGISIVQGKIDYRISDEPFGYV